MLLVLPLSPLLLVGTSDRHSRQPPVHIPLVVAAFPFVARLVEASLRDDRPRGARGRPRAVQGLHPRVRSSCKVVLARVACPP